MYVLHEIKSLSRLKTNRTNNIFVFYYTLTNNFRQAFFIMVQLVYIDFLSMLFNQFIILTAFPSVSTIVALYETCHWLITRACL